MYFICMCFEVCMYVCSMYVNYGMYVLRMYVRMYVYISIAYIKTTPQSTPPTSCAHALNARTKSPLDQVCFPVVSRAPPQQVLLASNTHMLRPASDWSAAAAVAVLATVAVLGLLVGFRVGAQAVGRAERPMRCVGPMSGKLDVAGFLMKYVNVLR